MIDFSKLDHNVVIARGQYSIVRGKREECLKGIQTICEELQKEAIAILRDVQDQKGVSVRVDRVKYSMKCLSTMAGMVENLDTQLGLIKPLAFPE